LTSGDVTGALGYTPYDSANPSNYITVAQARGSVSASGSLAYNSSTGVFSYTTPSTSGITEGSNLYYTDSRARGAVSATGSLSYNSSTGVFSYTTPTTSGITEGSNLYYTDSRARAALSAGTGISYNSTTGAISSTITQYTDALARGAVSATGSLSYNSSTGVFSYTTPSTTGITEGTNLYYTDARARAAISVTGSGSYNSTTGVITVTGGVTSVNTRTGAITLTSSDVGLGSVENKSSATIRGELTSSNVTTALGFTPYNSTNPSGYISGITSANVTGALGYTPENSANRGVANGYASLNSSGQIPSTQLPSYVDDVLEAANLAAFPASGETGKIYVALDTNKTYRWSGSAYVYITSGAVDSVAGKTGVVTLTNSDVGLGSVENKSSATIRGEITSSNVTTALGFTPYNSTNPSGYITGITSSNVTTALGFTPYNATNPSGYITSSALSGYLTSATASSTYLPLSGGTLTGAITGTTFQGGGWGSYLNPSTAAIRGNGGYGGAFALVDGAYGIALYSVTGTLHFGFGSNTAVTAKATMDTNGNFNTAGAITQASNQVLHAGNYNSYAPTLTGTGASGTWGISVTGTANNITAYTINQSLGTGNSPTFDSITLTNNGNGTNVKIGDDVWIGDCNLGNTFRIRGNDPAQGYIVFGSDTTQLGRNGTGALTWGGNALLTAGNYGSYALPLSGGTVSGVITTTGGIAAVADSVANDPYGFISVSRSSAANYSYFGMTRVGQLGMGMGIDTSNNVWFGTTSSGYNATRSSVYFYMNTSGDTWSNSSSRAPIFYDSADTGYYINANSNSNLNTVYAQSYFCGGGNGYGWYKGYDNNNHFITIRGAVSGTTTALSITGAHQTTFVEHMNPADTTCGWFFKDSYNGGSLNYPIVARISRNNSWFEGALYGDSSVRSPIFYDSNNTSYYCDPASNSVLSQINSRSIGNLMYYQGFTLDANTMETNATGFTYAVNAPATGPVTRFSTGGGYDLWLNAAYSGGNHLYFRTRNGDAGTINGWRALASYGQNYGDSLYATVLYDANDTGYYCDPNSKSYFASLNINGASWISFNNEQGSWGIKTRNSDSTTWLGANLKNQIFCGGGSPEGFSVGGIGTGGASMEVNNAGNMWVKADVRAPIFYDLNDTGYYVDPAGGNARISRDLYISGNTGGSYGNRLIVGNTDTVYTLQDTNVRPTIQAHGQYPVLSLNHTVTSNGSHGPTVQFTANGTGKQFVIGMSGNGSRLDIGFSSAADWNPHNGIGDYNGTTGWRMDNSGNTYSFVSDRSPIFYDNNDTAFYTDPNSTSNLNNVTVTGTLRAYANPVRINRINWVSTADSPASDPYCFRWRSETDGDTGSQSWLELQMNDDAEEEFRIYGYSCSGYGCGAISGNLYHRFYANGNAWHAGNVTAYSDIRVKDNIRIIDNAVDKVMQIRGVTFTRTDRADTERRHAGVIAQEVEVVLPEVVDTDEFGTKSVAYGNMVGLLIEAIKEQQKQIEELKRMIEK
jgi:hypothetical protein